MSLNAVVNACNQKSSRDPVMELSEADVRSALFELERLGVVRVLSDARVSKFEHLAYGKLSLGRPEIAVLGLLLLRGPQTPAELRARAERMYTFDDTAAVTAVLDRMAAREEPLVAQMARQPGARESRWAHLLGGSAGERAAGWPESVGCCGRGCRVAGSDRRTRASGEGTRGAGAGSRAAARLTGGSARDERRDVGCAESVINIYDRYIGTARVQHAQQSRAAAKACAVANRRGHGNDGNADQTSDH